MSATTDLDRLTSIPRRAARAEPVTTENVLSRVESLLAHPSDTGAWWVELVEGVDDLGDALWEHRALVEGPAGLHREIVEEQPRLAFAVHRLENDHVQLCDELAQLRLLLGTCMGRAGGLLIASEASGDLVVRLRGHLQRSDTLVHEAFERDLGGGD